MESDLLAPTRKLCSWIYNSQSFKSLHCHVTSTCVLEFTMRQQFLSLSLYRSLSFLFFYLTLPFLTSLSTTGMYLFIKKHTKGHFLIWGNKGRGSSTPWALCLHVPVAETTLQGTSFSTGWIHIGSGDDEGYPIHYNEGSLLWLGRYWIHLSTLNFLLRLYLGQACIWENMSSYPHVLPSYVLFLCLKGNLLQLDMPKTPLVHP